MSKPMNRWIATCAAAALTAAAAVGCNSNAYSPDADNAKLSAVAAKMNYPRDLSATESPNLTYSIADDGTITLSNAGDMTLSGFNVWVNKAYFLMVNKPLAAHAVMTFGPELFYNQQGQSLKDEKVSQSWTVQVQDNNQLLNAKLVRM